MSDNNLCPCCGRHCSMNALSCERGKEYASTGVIPERKHERNKPADYRERYEALDINNKLIWNFRDIGKYIRSLYEGRASQKRILIILREAETITQRELTERLGVQPGSASEVIGKLENAGLIVRQQSEEDRRTTNISLTDEGKLQAEEAAKEREERHQTMFACLNEEEKETILRLLEKINSDWEQRYSENQSCHRHGEHGRHGEHERHGEHGRHGEHEGHRGHGRHIEYERHDGQGMHGEYDMHGEHHKHHE